MKKRQQVGQMLFVVLLIVCIGMEAVALADTFWRLIQR